MCTLTTRVDAQTFNDIKVGNGPGMRQYHCSESLGIILYYSLSIVLPLKCHKGYILYYRYWHYYFFCIDVTSLSPCNHISLICL